MQLMQYFQHNIALGSDITLVLVSPQPKEEIDTLFQRLWQKIYQFERSFSRFLPQSELSLFNRLGGHKRQISPAFRELLLTAKSLALTTDGLYNPFVLPALQRAGYTKSFVTQYADDPHDDYSHRLVVSASMLEIGDTWAQIPYGTALDLGGCGKGYLADHLAAALPSHIQGYWFSLGGDIAAGGTDEHRTPWTIHVDTTSWTMTHKATRYGVATSGTTLRAGKNWHHLIDPRTQLPAKTDVIMATVCRDQAISADVLASCAVLLGSKDAWPFLKARGVKDALLQTQNMGETQFKPYGTLFRQQHTLSKGESRA